MKENGLRETQPHDFSHSLKSCYVLRAAGYLPGISLDLIALSLSLPFSLTAKSDKKGLSPALFDHPLPTIKEKKEENPKTPPRNKPRRFAGSVDGASDRGQHIRNTKRFAPVHLPYTPGNLLRVFSRNLRGYHKQASCEHARNLNWMTPVTHSKYSIADIPPPKTNKKKTRSGLSKWSQEGLHVKNEFWSS